MDFLETPLALEYNEMIAVRNWRYTSYRAIIVTEKEEIEVLQVVSKDVIRNYRNAAMDEVLLTLVLSMGDYIYKIIPFKENLRLTLTRHRLTSSGERAEDEDVLEATYDAYLLPTPDNDDMGNSLDTDDIDTANLMGIRKIMIQIQDPAESVLRSQMTGGSFRDCRPFDVLMALINDASNDLDVEDEFRIEDIHAVKPNNMNKRSNIILPHGIPLVSVASKLQEQYGGIYTAGIGCYLQKGHWWIWPLYDYKRYDEAQHTALFIIAPDRRLKGVENTYRQVDDHVVILISGGVSKTDPSEVRLLNEGNGTRYADPNNLIEDFAETKGNKAVAKRSENVSEYEAIGRRGQRMNRVTEDLASTNAFNEASKLVERNGAYVTMVWENSDPDLIIPGLQAEIGFMANDEAYYLNGVVVHVHAYTSLLDQGLQQLAMSTTTEVVLMVDRNNPVYEEFIGSQQE